MRKITLLMLSVLFALHSPAGDITQTQAQRLAGTFLSRSAGAMKAPSSSRLQLKPAYTAVGHDGKNCFYTFNIGSSDGFIIVSADDRAYEILGYSDTGSFDYDSLSPDMKAWLDGYADQIRFIREKRLPAVNVEAAVADKAVAPLLGEIRWNQNSPYNDLCPSYDLNQRCATGCVATAMAQVMYYHKWPVTGQGSYTYRPSVLGGNPLTADFGNTTYAWSDMLPVYDDTSSKASREAVARLMLHCGISVSMEYSTSSGATSEAVPVALFRYFNYDKGVAYRTRDNYSNAEWESVIFNELDNGRPIVALGRSSSGGHAFVFDGYDANGLIHVNWGWGGMSNGYFRMTALTPAVQGIGGADGGFNYNQYIITGIQPPKDDTETDVELVSTEGLVPSSEVINNGETADFRLCGMIANVGWQDSFVELGLMLTDKEGNLVKVVGTDISDELKTGYQYYGPSFKDISLGTLADGDYILYPVCRVQGGKGKWSRVRDEYIGYPNYLYVKVENGLQKFSYPEYFNLEVSELTVPGTVYATVPMEIKATIVNNGDVDYLGEVVVSIVNKDTKRSVTEGDAYKIGLKPGDKTELSIVSSYSLEPGDYSLTITDDDGRHICRYSDITVKAAPVEAAVVEVADQLAFTDNNNVDKNSLDITARLTCSSGVYGGYLCLFLFNENGTLQEGCLEPRYFFANEGETVSVTLGGPFENGVPGNIYTACLLLYDGSSYSFMAPIEKSVCQFRLGGSSSVGGIETDSGGPAAVYDINGRMLPVTDTGSLGKGIYILKKGRKTVKIVK